MENDLFVNSQEKEKYISKLEMFEVLFKNWILSYQIEMHRNEMIDYFDEYFEAKKNSKVWNFFCKYFLENRSLYLSITD